MSNIVVLNGTSSAGKTTVAKALQRQLDEPYVLAGIDQAVFMLPPQYLVPPLWGRVFEYEYAGGELTAIRPGPLGHDLMAALHRAVGAYAEAGLHVIVDHVLLDRRWLDDMAALYAEHRVWFVGVRCPLAVVEERERARRDRTIGQVRAQFDMVHAGCRYDFEIDTSLHTPEDCARLIVAHMQATPAPRAFADLRTAPELVTEDR